MAKYELPIYGAEDEILKTYATNHVPWGVYIKAADMESDLADKTARQQFDMVGELLMDVFDGLTNDELMKADGADVMNTFAQIVTGGQQIKGGKPSKNR